MHTLPRRTVLLALLLPALLAACGVWERADPPAKPIEPLRYDHLTKLRLNVAVMDVEDHFLPGGPGDISASVPTTPAHALRQMAQDRILAVGTTGRAVLVIKRAALVRSGKGLEGQMDVELALFGPNTIRAAFAEAQVYRRQGDASTSREALHELTRQMMDTMNVELEFQARRNLREWILPFDALGNPANTIPAPVDREELSPLKR
ncbi:MAG: hypothetical protein EXR05_10150 [Acetobacteraceae bacterium]|nr:hypothetical protein [Acetobacteraceae bacterium]MSP31050.1 hypothetical protein [Acetobacteraceae bacterium]